MKTKAQHPLAQYLGATGLSCRQLAKQIGCHHTYLRRILLGLAKNPSLGFLVALNKATGIGVTVRAGKVVWQLPRKVTH